LGDEAISSASPKKHQAHRKKFSSIVVNAVHVCWVSERGERNPTSRHCRVGKHHPLLWATASVAHVCWIVSSFLGEEGEMKCGGL
jgi:hypothetical protein